MVAADQATKTWAEHQSTRHLVATLWLSPTINPGAAFGLGRGVTPVIEVIVVVLVVALVVFGRRAGQVGGWPGVVALGLLVGGAVGNLVDRLARHNHGGVVDFIAVARVGARDWWPVFNVADACVVVGAAVLAVVVGVAGRRRPEPG